MNRNEILSNLLRKLKLFEHVPVCQKSQCADGEFRRLPKRPNGAAEHGLKNDGSDDHITILTDGNV